jgi:hypothetical protein
MKKPEATSLTPLIQAGKAGDTIQCFKLSTDHQTNYPKFKRFVQNEMPKTANDTRITANLIPTAPILAQQREIFQMT